MKRIAALVLVLVLIFPNIVMASGNTLYKGYDMRASFIGEILEYIKNVYPFDIEDDTLVDGALRGMLQSVDPYSNYYSKGEWESIFAEEESTGSIGIYIEKDGDYVRITDTIEGEPAEKVGLKKGDLIITVDGKYLKGLSLEQISQRIRGEEGSTVKLKVKRDGVPTLIEFSIKRKIIIISPVKYEIMGKDIGYIKLDDFSKDSHKDMKKALDNLNKKNIEKIILDLRDNLGGNLDESIEISRLFVPKGEIVHVKEKGKAPTTYISNLEKMKYKLIVLVNENSASASEIVAGAIKDRKSGTLVGTKTFGKGTVQGFYTTPNGGLMKLTMAEYFTPNMKPVNKIGIEPDILVKNKNNKDLQLEKAIELLK